MYIFLCRSIEMDEEEEGNPIFSMKNLGIISKAWYCKSVVHETDWTYVQVAKPIFCLSPLPQSTCHKISLDKSATREGRPWLTTWFSVSDLMVGMRTATRRHWSLVTSLPTMTMTKLRGRKLATTCSLASSPLSITSVFWFLASCEVKLLWRWLIKTPRRPSILINSFFCTCTWFCFRVCAMEVASGMF